MAEPAKVIKIEKIDRSSSSSNILLNRASRDLVVALMGPVGSGLPAIVSQLREKLIAQNYEVHTIKISEFINQCIQSGRIDIGSEIASNRYLKYQTAGNRLREIYKTEVLAEYAINKIGRIRFAISQEDDFGKGRKAFIIDQLKHPDEIRLLRLVYRQNLYVVGVMSLQKQRESRLLEEGFISDLVTQIIERDRKEPESWGQQLEKAFKLADYYLSNPFGNISFLSSQVDRFVSLIHGSNSLTPSTHEHAMYIAYAAGIKSACLSRQVGAAISNVNGRIIAVGANDVPSPGGGLYTPDGREDHRCFKVKKCENWHEKKERLSRITDSVKEELSSLVQSLAPELQDKLSQIDLDAWSLRLSARAKESSGIVDLIEFSRAVHAEMDALISLSRSGGGVTQNGTLYTTTFPCHNCARHIIAAGIKKVYYIEPYEKSLALASHSDAIDVVDFEDPSAPYDPEKTLKVQFIHFSGVAPRVFNELFSRDGGRKSQDGSFREFVDYESSFPEKVTKEYRDSYLDFEKKIAAIFDNDFPS